jgi:ABC-type lipoprotein export system ATPase subunit
MFRIHAGRMNFSGRADAGCGFIFQSYTSSAQLTVNENIQVPLL